MAVWLYFRFPLSLRMVEEMLAARGIDVSHETVRRWAEKFGRDYANRLRRRAIRPGDTWHLDENRDDRPRWGSGAPLRRRSSFERGRVPYESTNRRYFDNAISSYSGPTPRVAARVSRAPVWELGRDYRHGMKLRRRRLPGFCSHATRGTQPSK